MNDGREFWEDPATGFSQRQIQRIPGFRAWLRNSRIPIAQVLADPANYDAPFLCSRAQMKKLERSILDEQISLSGAHLDSQMLSKAVARLNHLGVAQLPQPRMSHLFQRPVNPLRADVTEDLHRVQAWLRLEREWIHECAGTPAVELVVLSAILHGGLWHKSSVVQFMRGLFHLEDSIVIAGNQAFLNMSLPWRGKPEMERRFGRLDEQTMSLIRSPLEYRNSREYLPEGADGEGIEEWTDGTLTTRLFRAIVRKMQQAGVERDLRPVSLTGLLNAVSLCARTELPPILVDYATRRIVSHSLKPKSMERIYAISLNDSGEELAGELSHEGDVKALADCETNDEGLEPPGLIELRKALRTYDRKDAIQRLEALLWNNSPPPNVWLLIASFAKYLLLLRHTRQRGIFARRELRVITAKACALTVARRLGRMIGDLNLLNVDVQTIETLYTRVLENVTEGTNPQRLRRTVALTLREFHEFLQFEHHVEEINEREVLGIDHGLLPVDANIVTLDEYLEARRIIRWELHGDCEEEILRAAEVMLILGFRCGTRRMEARDLRISDQGDEWLFIRPWQERGLKTANAIRQLPLRPFVSEDELEFLCELKRLRERQTAGREGYLFGIPTLGMKVVHEDRLMRIIHRALRTATGDSTVHYHHLRHSFATFTFLRLMLAELPQIPDLFPRLPATTGWLRESRNFKTLLYGTEVLTRRHAYTVASLLGHCGPEISLEHYVHCLDWLLPLFLERSDSFSPRNVIEASGFSKSTAYGWRANSRVQRGAHR